MMKGNKATIPGGKAVVVICQTSISIWSKKPKKPASFPFFPLQLYVKLCINLEKKIDKCFIYVYISFVYTDKSKSLRESFKNSIIRFDKDKMSIQGILIFTL